MKFVSIIIGSKSDYAVMKECATTLEKFGVPFELIISSAHRSPERARSEDRLDPFFREPPTCDENLNE